MDQTTESRTKAQQQAEVRPIWGGFMGTPATSTAATVRNPNRAIRPRTVPDGATHAARVGCLDTLQPAETQPSTVMLRLNSRAAATFAGCAAVGTFVLVAFLGSAVGIRPAAATASNTHAGQSPQAMNTAREPITWSGGPAHTSLSVGEYGEQVAIATLTSSLHQVDTDSVTFYADPKRSGNALQQFAVVFGEAIATGRNPLRDDIGPRPDPRSNTKDDR